ncbi:hypothetical protein BC940DRAFT_111886 [Gongronella butleri]|nr:hypothetical protein BC940DRAFT_111886 [Gongronella butleri]
MYKLVQGSSESPVTLRALIPVRFVGKIIGPRGRIHQQLEYDCDVKMYFDEQGANVRDRLLSIAGQPPSLGAAFRHVLQQVQSDILHNEFNNREKFSVKFLIPSLLVERLKAKPSQLIPDGCILHEIAEENHCRLVIHPDPLPNTTEHTMDVIVSRLQKDHLGYFERAVTHIAEQFRAHRFESMSPYNVYFSNNPTDHHDAENHDDSDEYCTFTAEEMKVTYHA